MAFVRQSFGAVTNLLYRGINAPTLTESEFTPARLAACAGDYWNEEPRVITRPTFKRTNEFGNTP